MTDGNSDCVNSRTIGSVPREETLAVRASRFVQDKPLMAVAAASAVGAALGGIVLSGIGRLAFAAVAGYLANEVWRGEVHIDLDHLAAKLEGDPKPEARADA